MNKKTGGLEDFTKPPRKFHPARGNIRGDFWLKKQKNNPTKQALHHLGRMKLLYETMSQGVVFQSANFKITLMNPAAEHILGKTSEELLGKTSEHAENDTFHEDGSIFKGTDHPTMVALRTGKPCNNVIMKIYNPRRNVFLWINITATPLFRPRKSKPYMVYAIFEDITEKIETEKALKLSQIERNTIINRIPAFIIVSHGDGRLHFINQAFMEFIGKSEQEIKAAGWVKTAVHPDDLTHVRHRLAQAIQNKHELNIELRIKKHNGEYAWFLAQGKPFLNDEGILDKWYFALTNIHHQKEAELALGESEERFRLLFMTIQEAVFFSAPDGKIIAANPAAEKMFGRSEAEICRLGRNGIMDMSDPRLEQAVQQRASTGHFAGELNGMRSDGTRFPVEAYSSIFHDSQGNPRTGTFIRDISERKKIEQAIRNANDRFNQIVTHLTDFFWITDARTFEYIYASPAFETIFGRSLQELLPLSGKYLNIVLPEDLHILQEAIQLQREQKTTTDVRYRIHHADGSIRWIRDRCSPVLDDAGEVIRVVGTTRDITSEMEQQHALEESEERFRQFAENINVGFWLMDAKDEQVLYANPAVEAIWGMPLKELIPKNAFMQTILPEHLPKVQEALQYTASGEITEMDYCLQRPNGTLCWVWDRRFPIRNGAGEIIRIGVVTTDISTIKAAQQELEEMNLQLEERVRERTAEVQSERDFAHQVMENMAQGLVVLNEHGTVEYANPALATMLGTSQAKLAGRSLKELGLPETLSLWSKYATPVRHPANIWQVETTVQNAAGETHTLLVNSTPRKNHHGINGSIITFTDISEEKEIEQNLRESRDQLGQANLALQQASRLKDEFISSMSHELRTPLIGILGLSDVLQMPGPGPLTEKQILLIKHINESGKRLLEMVNNILDYSLIEADKLYLNPELCTINQICQHCIQQFTLQAQEKKQHFLFSNYNETLMVRADARRIKQIVCNLVNNAIKFTPEGGNLGITLSKNIESNSAEITVWDTGIGIPSEDMARLFQPFVQLDGSMERRQPGAGLGLALAQQLARLHGGHISVQSTAGQGCRFTISLPLA